MPAFPNEMTTNGLSHLENQRPIAPIRVIVVVTPSEESGETRVNRKCICRGHLICAFPHQQPKYRQLM
ncbi:MAG: hypothetical protein AAFP69_08445 [Planctomycetota bacterium]